MSDPASMEPPNGLPVSSQKDIPTDRPLTDEPHQDLEQQNSPDILTPLRAHYLKKTLITLQCGEELSGLTHPSPHPNVSPLSYLGQPFTPPPKDAPALDFPFIRYMFRQFVLTFPFLAAAPKDFFPQKLQPFLASLLARNLSATSPFDEDAERQEQATREKAIAKLQKQLALFLGSATKLVEPEEVVRLSQKDLERLETLARKRRARELKATDAFDVNIVGVRTVVSKGRVRSRAHEEFLIRTRRSHRPDVIVSRRHGDFRTLADELRKAHSDFIVPLPPGKDRTAVAAPLTPPNASPSFQSMQSAPITRSNTTDSGVSFDGSNAPPTPSTSAARLAREKNRLTLRAYLHMLLSSATFASSPVLKSFLLSGPTTLTPAEVEDAKYREEADQMREEGRRRFARELATKVDGLRDAVKSAKGDVLGKDGLRHIFATIKVTSDVRGLPPNFQAVLEWARISLASTVFQNFVASDSASETLASLKRIHGLMPYFVLKGILKISNPIGMIRGVLDLFLAQPFGGRSLLQRMFTTSLAEEAKALQEDIQVVQDKIDDPVLCEKLRLFVYAPREIQAMFKDDAVAEKLDILTIVLRSSEAPALSRAQMQRVVRAHRAHAEYIHQREALADSDDDDGPQNDDAWLFEDLTILGKLYSRLRDREQLMELIFEGTTAELLKDIITIFYAPLAQVYKAASIADSLGDLQNFINDLIKTVEHAEDGGQQDPASTVKMFVGLVQRHEQAFYSFVHKVHSKGEGLFDSLMRWIELFLTIVREGIGEPISLEFLLPHTGQERREIFKEIDAVALYHYRLKVAYESKVRKRFGRGEAVVEGGDAAVMTAEQEDEAAQALVDGVVRDIDFGDLVQGDAEDLAAEVSESEESDLESETEMETETETETDGDSYETADSGEEQAVRAPLPSPAPRQVPATARLASSQPTSSQGSLDVLPPSSSGVPPPRKRSLSLRSLKSSDAARKAWNATIGTPPPVPPLPMQSPPMPKSAPASRHSTPAPRRRQTTQDLKKPVSVRPHAEPRPSRTPKKKQAPDIKPPELKRIPGLLPLFIEMTRPLLQPRAV